MPQHPLHRQLTAPNTPARMIYKTSRCLESAASSSQDDVHAIHRCIRPVHARLRAEDRVCRLLSWSWTGHGHPCPSVSPATESVNTVPLNAQPCCGETTARHPTRTPLSGWQQHHPRRAQGQPPADAAVMRAAACLHALIARNHRRHGKGETSADAAWAPRAVRGIPWVYRLHTLRSGNGSAPR